MGCKMLFAFVGLLLLPLITALSNCTLEQLDVVFVVDESNSFGPANFATCLEAATEMVNSLPIGLYQSDCRIGFVKYGSSAQLGFNLGRYSSKTETINAIRSLSYNGGGTNIAAGMDMAIREAFTPYGRQTARKIMILMTDGDDSSDVATEQRLALENNIVVYAVRITNGSSEGELVNATGAASRVFTATNFAEISSSVAAICNDIAAPQPSVTPSISIAKGCGCDDVRQLGKLRYWLDIILIVDSSDGVSFGDFVASKSLLSSLTNLNVNVKVNKTDEQYSRMAIINFGQTAEVFTELNNNFTAAEYRKTIEDNFKSIGGSTSGIGKAMALAHDMIMDEENAGRRTGVKKVIVLITTSGVKCHIDRDMRSSIDSGADPLCPLVSVLKNDDVAFITVAVKEAGVSNYPLVDIASECNSFHNDEQMIQNVLQAFCRANCFCKRGFVQFAVGDDDCRKYGECFQLSTFGLPHDEAEYVCDDVGGHLPDIFSTEKDRFLRDIHLHSNLFPFWTGLQCNSNSSCSFSENSAFDQSGYSNWCINNSQPNFSNGNCVYEGRCSESSNGWFAAECDDITTNFFFSCQVDACSVANFCP